MEYESETGRGLIGIEVKYTELRVLAEVRIERRTRSERPNFTVLRCDVESQDFREGNESQLITDGYRQIWRNQLLGECILQKDKFAHATLITMYPSANKHMTKACEGYRHFLASPDQKFVAPTYERFIRVCREHVPSKDYTDWLDYLQDRYIVKSDPKTATTYSPVISPNGVLQALNGELEGG